MTEKAGLMTSGEFFHRTGYELKSEGAIKPDVIYIYPNATSYNLMWQSLFNFSGAGQTADEVVPWAFDYAVADANTIDWQDLNDLGFANGSKQYITVVSPGAVSSSGTSTATVVGGKVKFTGRCGIWTDGNSAASIKRTVAHEFTHCLGIAHNCGYFAYDGNERCAMLYSNHWVRDLETGIYIPWSQGSSDGHLCAPHIKVIRETNLEDEGPSLKLDW